MAAAAARTPKPLGRDWDGPQQAGSVAVCRGGVVGRVRQARWDLLPKDRPWPSLIGLELGSGGEKNTPRKGVLEPGMFMGR